MGKLQSDKTFIITHPAPKKLESPPDAAPPQIPPRMKKKGPALPEKPPHIRAKTNPPSISSQPPTREPLKPRILNLDKFPATEREVLVAASKSGRERPVEKRQREPAKLLKPTSGGGGPRKELAIPSIHLEDGKRDSPFLPSVVNKKEISVVPSIKSSSMWALDDASGKRSGKSGRPLQQPILLIPRNLLTSWGSAPISYALWTQRDIGRGVVKPSVNKGQPARLPSETSATSVRSGSVTRSGSLTSQGSSSSDSGGETFPKSVLKKQKRAAANTHPSKGIQGTNRRVEPKKNVTFNAFATVQLMEE